MIRNLLVLPLLAVASLVAVVPAIVADERVSEPKAKTVPLMIQRSRPGRTIKQVSISIPKKFIEGVKVAQAGLDGDSWRTMIAGLTMSLAVGSVVVLRKRSTSVKAAVIALVFLAGGMTTAMADVPPPPVPNGVEIRIVEDGDTIQLLTPSAK